LSCFSEKAFRQPVHAGTTMEDNEMPSTGNALADLVLSLFMTITLFFGGSRPEPIYNGPGPCAQTRIDDGSAWIQARAYPGIRPVKDFPEAVVVVYGLTLRGRPVTLVATLHPEEASPFWCTPVSRPGRMPRPTPSEAFTFWFSLAWIFFGLLSSLYVILRLPHFARGSL
jgi:hypothetical protein